MRILGERRQPGRLGAERSLVSPARCSACRPRYSCCGFPASAKILGFVVQRLVNGSKRVDFILPPDPAPGACSTAAQEYSISELPTRLSPSLPVLVLPPVRAHRKSGARAAVFFSPAIPPSISAVREFSLRCPLLTPHNLSVYKYCRR